MNLYEYEGKSLFQKYGIAVPKSILITKKNWKKEIKKINKIKTKNVVLKAQVLHGKRRKLGLILFSSKENTEKEIKKLFQKNTEIQHILVEEQLALAKEYYLSITINQSKACYSLLFSEQGGIDIEEVPKNKIKKIDFFFFDTKTKKQIQKITKNKEITTIAEKLFQLFKENDATLVEVNPLALVTASHAKKYVTNAVRNLFFCLDAKITIDENALFHHKEFEKSQYRNKTPLEKEAAKHGIHYVELTGNIAVIGNGAGLVMATLDILRHYGLKPANFLDAPGGTTKEAMLHSLQIALKKPGIKALFINMFGGLTETDAVAQAIIAFKKKYHPRIPFVLRIYGTHWEQAHALLQKKGILAYSDIGKAIQELKRIIQWN